MHLNEQQDSVKVPYEAPKLVCFGQLEEFVQGFSSYTLALLVVSSIGNITG
jgi:hypothetical protein